MICSTKSRFVLLCFVLIMSSILLEVNSNLATANKECQDSDKTAPSESQDSRKLSDAENVKPGESSAPEVQATRKQQLTLESLNPNIVKAQYAVRGEILQRALELEHQLNSSPDHGLPFEEIIKCNIGNPQALKQKPITYMRQVLSLVMNPSLLEDEYIIRSYQPDTIERARKYLDAVHSVGAYSHSKGIPLVRQEICDFISNRDDCPCDVENIYLTEGASSGVADLLNALIRDENDAIIIPIPQYPLYDALISLYDGQAIGYELDEESRWEVVVSQVERAIAEAKRLRKNVRAMVIINPGNPTGGVLSYDVLRRLIQLCQRENILLLADEVYQKNIYGDRPFVSAKRVLFELQKTSEDYNDFQLASFHSISKGFTGECGLRGGYYEVVGFSDAVKAQLYKVASIKLCSNTIGQIAVGLMVQPPQPHHASYALYQQETSTIFDSLRRRAEKLAAALNRLPGVSVPPIDGALYAFPQVELSPAFCAAAARHGKAPDTFYALKLLESTGIVVVPGSGFGKRDGKFNFRTTFLPPEEIMDAVIHRLSAFHRVLVAEYS